MKDQYVGDIGDYGKYGLLRFLANRGIKIGVNWYLTKNDDTNDGKFRDYLADDREDGDKCYNKVLFDKLKPIAAKKKDERNISDVETNDIIPNAVFFHEFLKPSEEYRTRWHARAMDALSDADLIFADPDNGFLISRKNLYRPTGIKYASIDVELREYYDRGQDVVCYCHKGRRKDDDWNAQLEAFNNHVGHNAKIFVLTFHRGTQRSFVFAIHPEREKLYHDLLFDFMNTEWGTHKAAGKKTPFTLDKSPADPAGNPDCPNAGKSPKQVTINIDSDTIDYFKEQASATGIPYQTLINLYLKDCAVQHRKPNIAWT